MINVFLVENAEKFVLQDCTPDVTKVVQLKKLIVCVAENVQKFVLKMQYHFRLNTL